MTVAKDLCIELSRSPYYITISSTVCPFEMNSSRNSLIKGINVIMVNEYRNVLGINKKITNVDQHKLFPEIKEELITRINSMTNKQNLGPKNHMIVFSIAMDRNISKYMSVLKETYRVLNQESIIL